MQTTLLTISRFTIAAWVGAATLFVVTGIREVTSTEPAVNIPAVKDTLVNIRFPAYYGFGFTLVGVSLVATLGTGRLLSPHRRRWVLGLLLLALGMMIADYFLIYQPLLEMITPPGTARKENFKIYHNASKYVNAADVALCFIAAVIVCLPVNTAIEHQPDAQARV